MSFLLNPFMLAAVGGGTLVTRFYMPSTGTPALSPAYAGVWTTTSLADRRTLVATRINSAMTDKTIVPQPGAAEDFVLARQYLTGPLAAQTLSGTVMGQCRVVSTSSSQNATMALLIRVFSSDGSTVIGTPLPITYSDSPTPGHELPVTTRTNRKFEDASESAIITLTPVVVPAGSLLGVEIGIREDPSGGSSGTATFVFGDDSGTDLPEDTTTTAANNPWLEFPSGILMQ